MYQQSEEERATTENTVRALFDYYSNNNDNLSKDEQKIYDKMKEYMGSAYDDLSWEDVDDIVNTMDDHKKAMKSSINQAFKNESVLQNFTSGYGNDWAASKIKSKLQVDDYVAQDMDTAQNAINKIISAVNDDKDTKIEKSTIEGYIKDFKNATYWYSLDDVANSGNGTAKEYIEKAMSKYGIESYRTGSNYIGYDQIAQLHEGESVLTKAATSNLKELVGDTNIKDLSSGSITSNISDGMSSVSSVIVDQTKTLVNKLDEIISVVSNLNPGVNNINTTAQKINRDTSEFALA